MNGFKSLLLDKTIHIRNKKKVSYLTLRVFLTYLYQVS